VLAVQRQVVTEFIDQHPGQETDIDRGLLQYVTRRTCRHNRLRVFAFDDRADVLQNHITARALSKTIADLLANHFTQRLWNGINGRGAHLDGLDRDAIVEAKAAVIDGRIACFLTPLVGDGFSRHLFRRWCNYTQTR